MSQEDGQPVIGASVVISGTTTGTVTDANGRFSLTVPSGRQTLRISYIGMEAIEVSARPNMRIVLTSNSKALDEVIVVAYGTQKKSAFTGSAAVLDNKELEKHTITNVTDALAGNVPGLQIRGASGEPGSGGGSINIRGISSLYADTDPLIIVDGAPYPASLSNIPPQDIASVTVLKDAASAALYGARGASGVILITTKRGNSREAEVSLEAKWGVNSRAIPDYDVIKNPALFYEVYYKQLYNYAQNVGGYDNAQANQWANQQMLSDLAYNVYSLPDGQNLIGLNGKLNPNARLGRSYSFNGETYYMTPDDWTDLAYDNTLRQEYTASVNAANDQGSFYASLSHLDDDGIIQFSDYQRTSARLKADYQLKPWMKLAANISYTHSNTTSNANLTSESYGSTNLFYYTSRIAPIYPAFVRVLDANGKPVIRTNENGHQQYDYGVAASNYGVQRPFLATGNPLSANKYNVVKSVGNSLHGNFIFDVDITKHLKFTANSTLNLGLTDHSDYENPYYGPKVGVNGELTKYSTNTLRQNHVQTLNYSNQWQQHELSVLLGHEWWDQKTRYLEAVANGGYSPDIQEINAFATKTDSKSYTSEYNVEGYFANAQYNYDNKYFASASFRRDASSRFAKDNRWGNFWSVGAAWLINKESFFNVSWVDQLKLKASIGQQGNDNIGNWGYIDLYTLSKSSDTSMAPTFVQIGNKDITWETITNSNVGVEFSLFKGRLTGSVDYYYRKTTDLLFWVSVPEAAGARGYYGNMGDIRNQGVELLLSGTILKSKDFQWDVTANIATNSTKILSLPADKIADNGGFYESGYWYTVDGSMYNYMNYAYAGVNDEGKALYYYDKALSSATNPDTGKPYNTTNNVSVPGKEKSGTTTEIGEASRYTTGSILPKAYGGFSTTVTFRGFDLTASFDYQLGGKVYDAQYQGLMRPSTSTQDAGQTYHVDVLKAWSATNTGSDIPRWQYGDNYAANTSDRWLTSASYLNFQSFTVGYTLPRELTQKARISRVRVYCSGENLYLWSARQGFDPRQSYSEVYSINTYSPVRTITGGIQLTF